MKQQNITELRQELARAHLIIALLSVVSIVLLALGATLTVVALDANLATVAGTLLGILAILSVGISFHLFTRKK